MATAKRHVFTSESVTEGHPDKVADQISDAVLDAILARDPAGRVACETLVTTGMAVVAGEITTTTYVHIPDLVRETVESIGYTDATYGFDGRTCAVLTSIDRQSPDIAMGVDSGDEEGAGRRRSGHDVRVRHQRDPGAHAAADHAGAPHRRAARRGAQGTAGPSPGSIGSGPTGSPRSRSSTRATARSPSARWSCPPSTRSAMARASSRTAPSARR